MSEEHRPVWSREHDSFLPRQFCAGCDEPWPCSVEAMRREIERLRAALIDADHEWALWREKWCASLDIAGHLSEQGVKALKIYYSAFAPDHTASEMAAALRGEEGK